MTLDIDTAIRAAEAACDAAGALLRGKFRRELTSEMKPDRTIVTEADAAAERVMRDVLLAAFPDHLVTGEELPAEGAAGRHQWVLDPIDGTIAFACGKAQFTTLCALLEDGIPVLGVIDQPHTGERWVGARGRETAFTTRDPFPLEGGRAIGPETRSVSLADGLRVACQTSRVTTLAEARLNTTDPYLFTPDERAVFERLRAGARIASFGGDAYAYGLLASGHVDLIFETGLSLHDIAALLPVLRGAGAATCDAAGAAYEGRPLAAGKFSLIAAANGALVADALRGATT